MFFFGHYFVAKDHSKCIQSYQHGDERANRCGFVRASLALECILRMRKQVIHLARRVTQAMEQNESEKARVREVPLVVALVRDGETK